MNNYAADTIHVPLVATDTQVVALTATKWTVLPTTADETLPVAWVTSDEILMKLSVAALTTIAKASRTTMVNSIEDGGDSSFKESWNSIAGEYSNNKVTMTNNGYFKYADGSASYSSKFGYMYAYGGSGFSDDVATFAESIIIRPNSFKGLLLIENLRTS